MTGRQPPATTWDPGTEPSPNGHGPDPFIRRRLGEGIARKRPRPRTLDGMIYPGKLHSLAGEPGAGKTPIALWWLLRVMSLGRPVMMIDEEAGPDHISDLLQAFGASSAMVDSLFHYYPFPAARWMSGHHLDLLHKQIAEVAPVVAVFDSTAAMLSAAELRENDPGDVTRFWNRVLLPIGRQHGCAVIVTDHDAKDGFSSRYARGSTAKLAVVDVAFKVSAITRFTRDQDGLLELRVTKDRPGCLHENWQITVTRNPLLFTWAKAGAPGPPPRRGGAMSPGKQKLADALTDTPATIRQLVDRIAAAHGHGMRADTTSRLLNELLGDGLADRIDQGPGVEALWSAPQPLAAAEPAAATSSSQPRELDWN